MRHLAVLFVWLLALSASATSELEPVRQALADARLQRTVTLADSLSAAGLDDPELWRLAGDACWLAGSTRALDLADSLQVHGLATDAAILRLKVDLLLGRPRVADDLARLEHARPGDPELRLVRWLLALDRDGDWEVAMAGADAVADGARCGWVPAAALLMTSVDRDSAAVQRARAYRDARRLRLFSKLCAKIDAGALWSGPCAIEGTRELPYVECGPEMGLVMTAEGGARITLALDTGTGSGLITLHEKALGEALPGPEILRLADGIWYHYMDGPADVVIKRVDFIEPPLRGRPVEYFDGEFSLADGCLSPFAIPDAALTVDPRAQRIWLRDRRDLARYLASVDRARTAFVAYVRRGGWIFVPARVDGHEVLMMVESGSRDVNVNTLAARRLGIESRDSTLEWNGKDYPVQRADLVVEVGGLTYRCPDALVDDFVLGNNLAGTASAGDLGPEFLRHYRFTIDPFAGRLILEALEPAG